MDRGINKRLGEYLKEKEYSFNHFGRLIDKSSAQVSSMITGGANFGVHLLESIFSACPDLDPEWLLTGEGEMLKNASLSASPNASPNRKSSNEKYINKGKVLSVEEAEATYQKREPVVVTVDTAHRSNVVMIDQQAAAGFPAHYQDREWYQDLPAFGLPWPEFQRDHYICLQASGDSMHPTIYHHDWLIAKQVTELAHIREGYIHVVLTTDGVVVKRVLKRMEERAALALKSDNPAYPTYDEAVDGILALYRVKYKLSANLPNEHETVDHRLNTMEARLTALEGNLKRT